VERWEADCFVVFEVLSAEIMKRGVTLRRLLKVLPECMSIIRIRGVIPQLHLRHHGGMLL
jgi:hypothetical protein